MSWAALTFKVHRRFLAHPPETTCHMLKTRKIKPPCPFGMHRGTKNDYIYRSVGCAGVWAEGGREQTARRGWVQVETHACTWRGVGSWQLTVMIIVS
jgi:hypothetical protein